MTVEQLSPVLDALQCGAMLVNRSGIISHANVRLSEMMLRRSSDLTGRSLLELYPDGAGNAAIRRALEHFDESREHEFYLPRADGTRLTVMLASRRVLLGGEAAEIAAEQRVNAGHASAAAEIDGRTTAAIEPGESASSPSRYPAPAEYRIVTVFDISRRQQAEEALQERYRDIANLSDTVLEQALALKGYAEELEQRVRDRTRELHDANMESIYMLAVASEAKDFDTGAHVRRIEHRTRTLAREMSLSDADADRFAYSSILHDVGKIHVPDGILHKPTTLTADEWRVMREHTVVGERILSRLPFFDVARSIARSHHENWDGSGYPDGLRGEQIPLAARIVRVADVYDALTSVRPYKPAWAPGDAVMAIDESRLFDREVVRAMLSASRAGRWDGSDVPGENHK